MSNFRVEHDTTIGGVKAFKVARVTSVKAAGSGSAQGTPISMESSGTSNGAFFVSTKGVFLGGSSNEDVNLKLKILAQGAEISMKQNAQTKIEQIQVRAARSAQRVRAGPARAGGVVIAQRRPQRKRTHSWKSRPAQIVRAFSFTWRRTFSG